MLPYIAYMDPMGHTLSQLSAIIKSPEPMTFPSERGLALRGRRAAGRELLGRALEPRLPRGCQGDVGYLHY